MKQLVVITLFILTTGVYASIKAINVGMGAVPCSIGGVLKHSCVSLAGYASSSASRFSSSLSQLIAPWKNPHINYGMVITKSSDGIVRHALRPYFCGGSLPLSLLRCGLSAWAINEAINQKKRIGFAISGVAALIAALPIVFEIHNTIIERICGIWALHKAYVHNIEPRPNSRPGDIARSYAICYSYWDFHRTTKRRYTPGNYRHFQELLSQKKIPGLQLDAEYRILDRYYPVEAHSQEAKGQAAIDQRCFEALRNNIKWISQIMEIMDPTPATHEHLDKICFSTCKSLALMSTAASPSEKLALLQSMISRYDELNRWGYYNESFMNNLLYQVYQQITRIENYLSASLRSIPTVAPYVDPLLLEPTWIAQAMVRAAIRCLPGNRSECLFYCLKWAAAASRICPHPRAEHPCPMQALSRLSILQENCSAQSIPEYVKKMIEDQPANTEIEREDILREVLCDGMARWKTKFRKEIINQRMCCEMRQICSIFDAQMRNIDAESVARRLKERACGRTIWVAQAQRHEN